MAFAHRVGNTRDGSSAEMPADKYAAMLARTTRIEMQNIAMLGKALDDGNDLVECSTVHPTCPTCARLQGRIYSISGNTPGYPSLYDTAFKNGYSIIHPNCRHQFFPYNPKFHTEEENERLQRDTHRPWDAEASDISTKEAEKYREQYAKAQMQMRQWNKELNSYGEYKNMCEKRGEEPTYKKLGSFRRAYRSEEGSAPYARTHYIKRDTKQFEEFKAVLGAENMPQTVEKFQEMKYNKDNQSFERLSEFRHYKKDNPNATKDNFETAKRVKACGAKGDVNIPPKIENTKGYAYNEAHIFNERHHNIVREEAENYIKNSCVSLTQRNGERIVYISEDGATCIDLKAKKIITSFSRNEYDEVYVRF